MLHTTRPRTLRLASILGTTLLLGLLTACTTDGNSTYVRMCEEKTTGNRTADSDCRNAPTTSTTDDTSSLYLWYYVLNTNSYTAPAIGSRLTSGSTTEPEDGEEIDEDIPENGGEVNDEDTTQEQAPETDENDGSSANEDDSDDDSGSSVSDDSGDDDSSSFSDAGDDD